MIGKDHRALFWLLYALAGRLLALIAVRGGGDASKDVELVLLRHEVSVLRRQTPRPRLEPADRFTAAFARHLAGPPAQAGTSRSTTDPRHHPIVGTALRAGEPNLGTPTHPRRPL